MNPQNVVAVVPARVDSTRLHNKVLLSETGKPLICHTIESIMAASCVGSVVVATDSAEIKAACRGIANVILTGPANCGTDRIASIVDQLNADLIVAVQADEPEIKPGHLEALVNTYTAFPACDIATLATAIAPSDMDNENVVKVSVSPTQKFAYHFWRTTESEDDWKLNPDVRRHLGIYAYSPRFLKWISGQPANRWEESERLEQLRAYYLNCRIRVAIVDHPYHGIDTREQYDAFAARWKAKHND